MSGETVGPWMGMVTQAAVPLDLCCCCKCSVIPLINRDFPMPERVELTTLTRELQVPELKYKITKYVFVAFTYLLYQNFLLIITFHNPQQMLPLQHCIVVVTLSPLYV